jgi:flavin-dependent dehydrogenase
MLFKAYPPGDTIKVIWIVPKRELWSNYGLGMICENKIISESIHDFQHNRKKLEQLDDDDLDDKAANAIYTEIARNAKNKKREIP